MIRRAFSLVNFKALREEEGEFVVDGIASTPTPDRMGDVVEPLGAKFALPIPLCLYHDAKKPVGRVTTATATKDGIPVEVRIPKVTEPGVVKDRVDEAVHSLKYRLIAGFSIGFRGLQDRIEMLKTGGLRFLEWEWLELSLVTIPANAEATIKSIEDIARNEIRAASGAKPHPVVYLKSRPGDSGILAPRREGVVYLNR